jgi:long-chain acyl-CoA synthetase
MTPSEPSLLPEKIFDLSHQTGVAVIYFKSGIRHELTWSEYQNLIGQTALSLKKLGLGKGSRIAIHANTCLEWLLIDFASQLIQAITIPIYGSSTATEVNYILRDSQADLLFTDQSQSQVIEKNDRLKNIINFGSNEWEKFLAKSQTEHFDYHQKMKFKKTDLVTIVYTSGTTGLPKGVCLTHEQVQSEVLEAFGWALSSRDTTLSFLPLSHILGRVEVWAHLYLGSTLALAEKIEKLKDHLEEVQPTLLVSVPRIYEKFYDTILSQMESIGPKRKVFYWALEIGQQVSEFRLANRKVPIDLALKNKVADELVFSKIRKLFGGKLRFAISGGAPLSKEIAEFFYFCGILILEGYGLTETTAAITVNRDHDYKLGTVGKPIGDVKIKIASDGEILVKSKKVMTGYHELPDETAAAFDDGWFKTGDIGKILPSGELIITDRKKDLIKTSGGKYVAPQKLEALLKENLLISQALVFGDQKKFIVALLQVDLNVNKNLEVSKVQEMIRSQVTKVNTQLASFESIKKFEITFDSWTVESGELTPSLKLKRKKIIEQYKNLIESMYD